MSSSSSQSIVITKNNLINKFWHSDSRLVFNSKMERKVIGRLSPVRGLLPLTEDDIKLCKEYRFDYIVGWTEETSTSQQLMSVLDDNKEEIPSGVYLQLANLLKDKHEEEKKEEKSKYYFVKVEYYYPQFKISGGASMNEVSICKSTQIIQLETSQFEHFQGIWERSHTVCDSIKSLLHHHHTVERITQSSYCEDCEDSAEDTQINFLKSVLVNDWEEVSKDK